MTNQSIANGTANGTRCGNVMEPKASIYFRLVITALILVVALVGNLVVLRAIRRLPGRKPFIYLLVGNLAVGEVGQVILQPFVLYYEQTWWKHGWPFGVFLCKVIHPLHNVFLANATATLGAIAVYRCLTVYSPPKRKLSSLKTKSLLASFWCVGLAIALPQSIGRELLTCSQQEPKICCVVNWDRAAVHAFFLIWGVVVQYIPMVTMIVAYALVAKKICGHITANKNQSRRVSKNSKTTSCPDCELQEHVELQRHPDTDGTLEPEEIATKAARDGVVEMEHNLLKMMYIIVVSFVVCYLPYQMMLVLHFYKMLPCWEYGGIFGMYSLFVLTNLPSALHPLFYGTKCKFFAKAFLRLLSCKLNSYPLDSTD